MNTIKVPRFALVITILTGLIATVLGVWASISPETHPQFVEGARKTVLSWSARELGQGLAALAAALWLRDARAIVIALGSSWVREILDFIDFFRIEGTPIRFYFVVGISAILHSVALYMSVDAIRKHRQENTSA